MSSSKIQSGALLAGIQHSFDTGVFSDLTITCGQRRFYVHKIILYAQSVYFQKLLGGQFMEGRASIIDFPDDDPDVLAAVFRFLYTSSFQEYPRTRHDSPRFCVLVYAAADKYCLSTLQLLVSERFRTLHCHPTREMHTFVDAVHAIIEHCRQGDLALWKTVVNSIRDSITVLLTKPEFQQLVMNLPRLNFELLGMLDKDHDIGRGMWVTAPYYGGDVSSVPAYWAADSGYENPHTRIGMNTDDDELWFIEMLIGH